MPTTRKGNPIPGRFPYVSGDITGDTSYTSSVLLSDLGFSCPGDDEMFSMAAHAAIQRVNDDGTVQTETGWSDGGRITDKGNWATLSTITLKCDCDTPPGPGDSCETAHAYYASQSTCFNLIDEDADVSPDFKKWGWGIGPLETGSYTFPLWAGAASGNPNDQECDTSKGTLVGDVQFHYNDDGTADVSEDTQFTSKARGWMFGPSVGLRMATQAGQAVGLSLSLTQSLLLTSLDHESAVSIRAEQEGFFDLFSPAMASVETRFSSRAAVPVTEARGAVTIDLSGNLSLGLEGLLSVWHDVPAAMQFSAGESSELWVEQHGTLVLAHVGPTLRLRF